MKTELYCHRCGRKFTSESNAAFCVICQQKHKKGNYFTPSSSVHPPAMPRMGICLDVDGAAVHLHAPGVGGRRLERAER